MATLLDSPVTFFAKATPEQFAYVFNKYNEVFAVHAQETRRAKKNGPAELIKLDNWYQQTLPQLIKNRKDKQMLYDEIVQITKWKLLRGKFRTCILDLVRTNTETAIKNVTKKAFKKMPNINAAITALTQLKGIAPATASAILVAHSPDLCPYMADENMAATPGVEESDLSISEYLNYVEQTNICVERLRAQDPKGDWTPHKVELAMWTLYQAKQYNSNLLDDMPEANGKKMLNNSNDDEAIGKLDDDSQGEEDERQHHEDEGVNSNESDENSNESLDDDRSEMVNGNSQNQLNLQSNGHHLNGNGLHGEEESNQSVAASSVVSSENEDKSNDSLLKNSHLKDTVTSSTLVTSCSDSTDSRPLDTFTSNELPNEQLSQHIVESSTSITSQPEQQQQETSEEAMEVGTTSISQLEPIDQQTSEDVKSVEELSNPQTASESSQQAPQITSNHNVDAGNDNATDKLVVNNDLHHIENHCNGDSLKNGISNNDVVFTNNKQQQQQQIVSLKDTLISSSEENSNNNLSEENSNLSNSNLSYTDLHSTDNALDHNDGPALKRIRVE